MRPSCPEFRLLTLGHWAYGCLTQLFFALNLSVGVHAGRSMCLTLTLDLIFKGYAHFPTSHGVESGLIGKPTLCNGGVGLTPISVAPSYQEISAFQVLVRGVTKAVCNPITQHQP